MNLNNFLKISSYFMVFFWLIASYTIILFEFGEILDRDVGLSPNWYCAVWPLVGSKLKCLDISWYAIELTSAIINSIFLVLLTVGMVKRKYMLMMPWIIFRFTSMLVSWSAFHLSNYQRVMPKICDWAKYHNRLQFMIYQAGLMSKEESFWQNNSLVTHVYFLNHSLS